MNLKGKRVRITTNGQRNGFIKGQPIAQAPIGTFDIAAWSLVQAGNGVGWSYVILCVNVQTGEIDQFALGEVTIQIIASEPRIERKDVDRPRACCARFAWGDGTHEPSCENFRGTEVETAAAAGMPITWVDVPYNGPQRSGFKDVAEAGDALVHANKLMDSRDACADPTCPGQHGRPSFLQPEGYAPCKVRSAFGARCLLVDGHPADSATRFHRFAAAETPRAEPSEVIASAAQTPDLSAALAQAAEERDEARAETERIRSAYEKVTAEADRSLRELRQRIAMLTDTPTILPSMTEGTEERAGKLYYCGTLTGEEVGHDDGAAYKEWAAMLVAQRNHARKVCLELHAKIEAFTRTGTVPEVTRPGDLYRRS